jgi:hypothetical protein
MAQLLFLTQVISRQRSALLSPRWPTQINSCQPSPDSAEFEDDEN